MYFEKVSPQAEKLLEEIVSLKNNQLDSDTYWHNRFESLNNDDDIILRSLFKELKESDLIIVQWADNIPYILNLTSNGKYYFENKEDAEKQRKDIKLVKTANSDIGKNKVFISHRSTDAKVVDMLFNFLVMCGVPRDAIFCSSLPGNDINQIISSEVKTAMKNSYINIALLSKDYYESAYCLNEAGIIWFKDDITAIPIALPEISHINMYGFLNSDYKIRRLNNTNDVAYIYDTICKALSISQSSTSILIAESSKLFEKYNAFIADRHIEYPKPTESCFNFNDITTDDECIILYYIVENKIKKVKENDILKWLRENEIENINVDNAFDLLSSIGSGNLCDGELELDLSFFRKLTSQTNELFCKLKEVVNNHFVLRKEIFKKMWKENIFTDADKLFIAYIIDENTVSFGDRWKADAQVKDIERWESNCSISNELSQNYGACLHKFINNKLVYACEWTGPGNPREYALYNSLKEFLFSKELSFTDELNKIKEKYFVDLPF